MFAALNTLELPVLDLTYAKFQEGGKPWFEERQVMAKDRVRARLGQLSRWLGDAEWLDGAFSAADLLMVTVLMRLKSTGLVEEFPNLAIYVARGQARPAYKQAFAAQREVFERAS